MNAYPLFPSKVPWQWSPLPSNGKCAQQHQQQRCTVPAQPLLHIDVVLPALLLADISETFWHSYFILLFSSETSMENFIIFHFFIKRKQLGAWVKAGESESKFLDKFPSHKLWQLPAGVTSNVLAILVLGASWEKTTVLPNCERVWSYVSVSLRGEVETTQSLLTCALIQILNKRNWGCIQVNNVKTACWLPIW